MVVSAVATTTLHLRDCARTYILAVGHSSMIAGAKRVMDEPSDPTTTSHCQSRERCAYPEIP